MAHFSLPYCDNMYPGDWSSKNVAPWLIKFFRFKRDMHPIWFEYIVTTNKKHGWHLVSRSPWPFWASCSALTLVMGLIFWMHKFNGLFEYNPVTVSSYLLWYGLCTVIGVMIFWFRDIIREAVYMGYHTTFVQSNLRLGFMLFIVSEVMFFASFFWAFFHSSINPSIWSGSIWPPEGIVNFFISEDIFQLLNLPSFASLSETFFNCLSSMLLVDFYLPFSSEITNISNFLYSIFSVSQIIDRSSFIVDHFGLSWSLANIKYDVFNDSVRGFFDTIFVDMPDEAFRHSMTVVFDDLDDEKHLVAAELSKSFSQDNFNYTSNPFYVISSLVSSYLNSLNLNLYDSGSLINPYSLPLINTFILLTSGAFLTWSHKSLRIESFKEAFGSLCGVLIFAWAFMTVQFHEYLFSAFSINDGIFGSTFFMLTGFHGLHVIIGAIFLIVCSIRFLLIHFTRAHHFGYEAAIWYWHFVDVVWVFLYLFVYFWPSNFFFDYSFNWSSILPINFDFALPTEFLTYLTDLSFEYPFHLIEKYAEVKEEVLKRFSLSTLPLSVMGGADDFYTSFNIDDTLNTVEAEDMAVFSNLQEDSESIDTKDRKYLGLFDIFHFDRHGTEKLLDIFSVTLPLDTFDSVDLDDEIFFNYSRLRPTTSFEPRFYSSLRSWLFKHASGLHMFRTLDFITPDEQELNLSDEAGSFTAYPAEEVSISSNDNALYFNSVIDEKTDLDNQELVGEKNDLHLSVDDNMFPILNESITAENILTPKSFENELTAESEVSTTLIVPETFDKDISQDIPLNDQSINLSSTEKLEAADEGLVQVHSGELVDNPNTVLEEVGLINTDIVYPVVDTGENINQIAIIEENTNQIADNDAGKDTAQY